MTSMPASRRARAITLAPRSWPSSPGLATTTRIGPAATPITASMKRLHTPCTDVPPCRYITAPADTPTARSARLVPADHPAPARAPHATPTREVNERYRQHPATGSFTVVTEGEITQWDTFAAQGPPSPRHT